MGWHRETVFKINELSLPSLLLAAERMVERLSDDRVSPNEAILSFAYGGYSPRQR